MNDLDRCFRTLELEPGASLEEVRRAWRDLTKVWHPDRFAGDPRLEQKAEERLKQVNDAYDRLRIAFAEGLAGGGAERAAAAATSTSPSGESETRNDEHADAPGPDQPGEPAAQPAAGADTLTPTAADRSSTLLSWAIAFLGADILLLVAFGPRVSPAALEAAFATVLKGAVVAWVLTAFLVARLRPYRWIAPGVVAFAGLSWFFLLAVSSSRPLPRGGQLPEEPQAPPTLDKGLPDAAPDAPESGLESAPSTSARNAMAPSGALPATVQTPVAPAPVATPVAPACDLRVARDLLAAGELAHALPLFEKCESVNAISPFDVGVLLENAGRLQPAADAYRRSAERWGDVGSFVALGVALGKQGRDQEAVEVLRTATQIGPNDANALLNFGIACVNAGRVAEARAAAMRLRYIDPRRAARLQEAVSRHFSEGR